MDGANICLNSPLPRLSNVIQGEPSVFLQPRDFEKIMNTPIPQNASTSGIPEMNPGDAAPAGTPGTGEDICPKCKGTGQINGTDCLNCGGTGRIVEGIGGG